MKPREAGEMQSRYDIGFGKSRSGGWSQKVPKGLCTMSLGVVRSILPPPPHFLFLCHLCNVSSRGKRQAVILLRARVCWVPSPELTTGMARWVPQQGSPGHGLTRPGRCLSSVALRGLCGHHCSTTGRLGAQTLWPRWGLLMRRDQ